MLRLAFLRRERETLSNVAKNDATMIGEGQPNLTHVTVGTAPPNRKKRLSTEPMAARKLSRMTHQRTIRLSTWPRISISEPLPEDTPFRPVDALQRGQPRGFHLECSTFRSLNRNDSIEPTNGRAGSCLDDWKKNERQSAMSRINRLALPCILAYLVAVSTLMSDDSQQRADVPRQEIYGSFDHFRIEGPAEWSDFPAVAELAELSVVFQSTPNEREWTLRLRQHDVKQSWEVRINGKVLGRLTRDENDMLSYFAVPPDLLVAGDNRLQVQQKTRRESNIDDIRLGQVELIAKPRADILSESSLGVEIRAGSTGLPVPSRITIVDSNGSLQTTGTASSDHLAVRSGIVYTSTGKAHIDLPARHLHGLRGSWLRVFARCG